MSDVSEALAVLQFGDSFFPSGAVSFSWGLEGLSDCGVVADADAVRAFVIGQLRARWAEFDRPVVVAAHQARMSLEEVAAITPHVHLDGRARPGVHQRVANQVRQHLAQLAPFREQPVVALAYFGMVVHQAATTPLRSARRRQIHMSLTP